MNKTFSYIEFLFLKQSDANHNPVGNIPENQNQSSHANGIVEDQSRETGSSASRENETGSQEFTISDVQELMHHVQWLQLQLKQVRLSDNNDSRTLFKFFIS